MQITLIGLGKMGTAMAQRIVQGNFNLTVFNRTKEKMQPLIQAGAKSASSAKDAAAHADIVLTALLDDASILQIVNGNDGFLTSLKQGAIHINTSTILPETAKLLARSPTLANIIKDKMMIALAQGMAEKDWSVVTEITRKEAGLD
jgi:3-hydroxyisobutyrate dehydrogenase-like beta-hydroxyacid dehydrogenase